MIHALYSLVNRKDRERDTWSVSYLPQVQERQRSNAVTSLEPTARQTSLGTATTCFHLEFSAASMNAMQVAFADMENSLPWWYHRWPKQPNWQPQ